MAKTKRTIIYMVYDTNDKRWLITSKYMYNYLYRRWGQDRK